MAEWTLDGLMHEMRNRLDEYYATADEGLRALATDRLTAWLRNLCDYDYEE